MYREKSEKIQTYIKYKIIPTYRGRSGVLLLRLERRRRRLVQGSVAGHHESGIEPSEKKILHHKGNDREGRREGEEEERQ